VFNGGQRFNIVSDTAHLEGTVRAFDEDMRKQALASLANIAEHVAAANGATIEAQIPLPHNNPVNYNDPALTARVRASLESALGKQHVEEAARWTASEDFPHLALGAQAPSVYFFVGSTPAGQDTASAPTNHSPKFFLDEGALAVGSEAMLQAALDFLGYR
jgi:metal-dependent amidase/aminoacylase/carboxypeptidase family protein